MSWPEAGFRGGDSLLRFLPVPPTCGSGQRDGRTLVCPVRAQLLLDKQFHRPRWTQYLVGSDHLVPGSVPVPGRRKARQTHSQPWGSSQLARVPGMECSPRPNRPSWPLFRRRERGRGAEILRPSGSSLPSKGCLQTGRGLLHDSVGPRGHISVYGGEGSPAPARITPGARLGEGAAETCPSRRVLLSVCRSDGELPRKDGLTGGGHWCSCGRRGRGRPPVGHLLRAQHCAKCSVHEPTEFSETTLGAGSSAPALQMRKGRHELVKSQDLNSGGSNPKAVLVPPGHSWAVAAHAALPGASPSPVWKGGPVSPSA